MTIAISVTLEGNSLWSYSAISRRLAALHGDDGIPGVPIETGSDNRAGHRYSAASFSLCVKR